MAVKNDMSILAFDTSGPILSMALLARCRLFTLNQDVSVVGSEAMFGYLKRLMKKASWDWSRVNVIAVGLGPGSFTGLRVGVTAAKTMAYGLNIPLVGLSSLAILASSIKTKKPLCVVKDAKRGNVYTATFLEGKVVQAPRLMNEKDYEKYMRDKKPKSLKTKDMILEAKWMIPMARKRIRLKRFDDPLKLKPHYLYSRDCLVIKSRKSMI
jgi:tRNA threonylcarbamoyl adenosine modification protein YeaZ